MSPNGVTRPQWVKLIIVQYFRKLLLVCISLWKMSPLIPQPTKIATILKVIYSSQCFLSWNQIQISYKFSTFISKFSKYMFFYHFIYKNKQPIRISYLSQQLCKVYIYRQVHESTVSWKISYGKPMKYIKYIYFIQACCPILKNVMKWKSDHVDFLFLELATECN